MDKPYDILAIMKRLPHRYPFLLIDRITALIPGQRVTAIKNVTFNEPFFGGHFPGEPIMPGVLIVEAMAQAGGVLAWETMDKKDEPMNVYFTAMDRVRFRKPVVPGDQLVIEVTLLRARSTAAKMDGTAKVDGKLAAEAEMMASFGRSS